MYDNYRVVEEKDETVVLQSEDPPVTRVEVLREEYNSQGEEEEYECPECSYTTDTDRGLSVHVAQAH